MDRTFFIIEIYTSTAVKPLYVLLNNIIIKIPDPIKKKFKYVVCSRLLLNFTRANYLIQHFESLKYFGVSKVVSYYTSATKDVLTVLSYYIKKGLLDLYKYDEEMEIIWKNVYYGQVGKLNHCYEQYKDVSKYIMECDYDEILWPAKGSNYDDIFDNIPKYDVYYTHTRFFPISNTVISDKLDEYYKKIKQRPLYDIDIFNLNITSCQTYNGNRRKYIVANTKKVLLLEVHSIVSPINIYQIHINTSLAFLRHTRQFTSFIANSCVTYHRFTKSKIIMDIEKNSLTIKRKLNIKLHTSNN